MKHAFWGQVESDWAGFSAEITFCHPFFGSENCEIFLGDEFDENGDEVEDPPSMEHLAEFEATYRAFLGNIESNLALISQKAFERYLKLYAHHFEDPRKSGEPAFHIDSAEKHDPHLKEVIYLRVCSGGTLRISIRYALDEEHGIEFKFVDNRLDDIGGIAET
ncbi:MAG: hypothetical protein IPN71_00740 [Fibrobacteres bacterium]|nr:hypothetical protein [Fibrobacterota bacterium]